MQQTQSPLLRLWQLGRDHHGGLIAAIFCAVAGVLLGLLPYLSAGRILVALLTGQRDWNFYLLWCMVALGGYLAKTLLYNLALSLSHKATFQILRDIRKMVLSKMPRLPLGDILDTSSGRLKQIVVDQVESMETTLAHLLPEMTSNLLAPVCVLVYLFRVGSPLGFNAPPSHHKEQRLRLKSLLFYRPPAVPKSFSLYAGA